MRDRGDGGCDDLAALIAALDCAPVPVVPRQPSCDELGAMLDAWLRGRSVPASGGPPGLLDDLGGLLQHRQGDGQSERPGGLEVDREIEHRGLFYR